MKNVFKLLIGSAGAAILLGMAAGAQAQAYPDVSWSINVGSHGPSYGPPVVYAPAPVAYPAPVIMRPRPVYVAAPGPYYPPVAYYGRPGWEGHRHYRHERWDHGRGRGNGHGRDERGHGHR